MMVISNFPLGKHAVSSFTLLKYTLEQCWPALLVCRTKEVQKSRVIGTMKWTLERPCFAEPTEITSPVWHYNLPSQNQQAARSSHALSKGFRCQKWKQAKNVGLKKHWAQLTDHCHGFQSQKVPARTGAKRSRMDRTAGNELSVYMQMMKAEKEWFKMKIFLIDKWFAVPFLPPLLSSHLLPRAAPLCWHHALHGEERSGVGQKAGELSGVLHQGHLFHRHYWAKRLSSLGLKERKDGATCIFSSDTAEHFASSFDASCFKFSLTATNLLIQPNLLSSRAVPLPKAHLQFDLVPLFYGGCLDFDVQSSGVTNTFLGLTYESLSSKTSTVSPAWIAGSGHWAML